MKIFFLIASILLPTFLFSQNEKKTENHVKEILKINKVKSRKSIKKVYDFEVPFDSCNFDRNGNIISSKYIYDSYGQLIKEYFCDSCRIWFWTYKYENGKIVASLGFRRDSLLITSIINEYDSLGRLSKYFSFRKEASKVSRSFNISDSILQEEESFKDVYDTVTIQYYGDTIKYISISNLQPTVCIERYNTEGFPIEYIETENKIITFRQTYEYDIKGNLVAKQSFNSEGKPYLKYLYFYDLRNLVSKMEYYQNDLTKPATTFLYEYSTE